MGSQIDREVAACLSAAGVGPADRVAVACSGGPDSAALACAVGELVRAGALAGATLIHVDHGLRDGSARDADHVADLARRLGLASQLARVRVEKRASLEAAAREARYRALDAIAAELGNPYVLLAHTASDQAETVLMRAVRGTGVRGLAGIPARRGSYLRPLLGVSRGDVERYIRERDIEAVEDPSNRDPAFTRNRFRHHLLPMLAAENPRIEEALGRLAASARAHREILEFAAEALLERARDPRSEALVVAELARAPDAVTGQALARAAEAVTARPVGARHREALLALARRGGGGSAEVAIPGGRAIREYGHLRFAGPEPAPSPPAVEGELAEALERGLEIRGENGPYHVRRWQPGDRMRPARLRGRSRKLSDLYIDAKVPRRLRQRARVVVRACDGEIAWAEHLGAANGAEIEVTLTAPEQLTSNRS